MTPEDYELNYSALAADYTALNTKYTALRLAVLASFSLDGAENLEEQIRDYARVQREVKRNAVSVEVAQAVAAERERCAKIAESREERYKKHDMFPAYGMDGMASEAHDIASAIRTRSGAK